MSENTRLQDPQKYGKPNICVPSFLYFVFSQFFISLDPMPWAHLDLKNVLAFDLNLILKKV